ncbi:MAG: class I SAM-dependent methyltransferase, partial [Planctomycetota bacterium]
GCGDGDLTELLAERFERVIAVDHSPQRLARARTRVPAAHVEFHAGELDSLPIGDAAADAIFLSLVLHHVPELDAALREAFRVLRAGGRLVAADLAPHGEEWAREVMGDLRLGLERSSLERALGAAGFRAVRFLPARDRLAARGRRSLELYLATAQRPADAATRSRRKETR